MYTRFTLDDYRKLAGRSFRIIVESTNYGNALLIKDADGEIRHLSAGKLSDSLRRDGSHIYTLHITAEPLSLRLEQETANGAKFADDVESPSPSKLVKASQLALPITPAVLFALPKYLEDPK